MNTLVVRLLEAENKGTALEDTLTAWRNGQETGLTFAPDPETFREVPGSPFAYWVSDRIRALFKELPPFESEGRTVKQGLATADDFRFVRCWWEVDPATLGKKWFPFAKGGKYSPFYADVHLVVNWEDGGQEIYAFDKAFVRNASFFFRPGLTWPIKNRGNFKPRALPVGSIFAHVGSCAFFPSSKETRVYWSLLSSQVFTYLLRMMAGWNYEVGTVKQVAVPSSTLLASSAVSSLSSAGWIARRRADDSVSKSHAFILPALLQVKGRTLASRADLWGSHLRDTKAEVSDIQAKIDGVAFDLYGIGDEDCRRIEQSFRETVTQLEDSDKEGLEETGTDAAAELPAFSASLLEWCVGVAFGRFDVRLATGERDPPPVLGRSIRSRSRARACLRTRRGPRSTHH